jgi:exodeoxyribonuclease-3
MVILSLNIRHGGGGRLTKILDYIISMNADIVVLTEFRNNKNSHTIKETLKSHAYQFISTLNTDATKNSVLVASRIMGHQIDLESPNNWSLNAVDINGIQLVGTYFPLKNDKTDLINWFLEQGLNFKKTIFIGDFNTGSNTLDKDEAGSSFFMGSEFETISQEILTDSFRYKNPELREYSWHSSAGNGFRIDHCLVTKDLTDNIRSVSYDHKTRPELTDHSALMVVISD